MWSWFSVSTAGHLSSLLPQGQCPSNPCMGQTGTTLTPISKCLITLIHSLQTFAASEVCREGGAWTLASPTSTRPSRDGQHSQTAHSRLIWARWAGLRSWGLSKHPVGNWSSSSHSPPPVGKKEEEKRRAGGVGEGSHVSSLSLHFRPGASAGGGEWGTAESQTAGPPHHSTGCHLNLICFKEIKRSHSKVPGHSGTEWHHYLTEWHHFPQFSRKTSDRQDVAQSQP